MTNLDSQLAPPDHNTLLRFAINTFDLLGKWLSDHPTVEDEDDAREAKTWKDRADNVLRSLDDEREGLLEPLQIQVKAINAGYAPYHSKSKPGLFDKILSELKARMTAYALAEERRRIAAAEEARRAAEAAEAAARAAEAIEFAALDDAKQGVVTDTAAATAAANEAFAEYERASRFAQRAQADTKVRLANGEGRASTLRTTEVLTVTDWRAAIEAIGLTDKIAEAILAGARAHRKETGSLPPGISRTTERAI
jgi:hypothetical protein